jgi:hypothetical protein
MESFDQLFYTPAPPAEAPEVTVSVATVDGFRRTTYHKGDRHFIVDADGRKHAWVGRPLGGGFYAWHERMAVKDAHAFARQLIEEVE